MIAHGTTYLFCSELMPLAHGVSALSERPAVERAMKEQEVILRAMARKIPVCAQTVEIIGFAIGRCGVEGEQEVFR
jgi:hypothetical protein